MSEPKTLELVSLSHMVAHLDRMFGADWASWEMETISEELGVVFTELLRDKVHIAQIMKNNPRIFIDDAMFFLHATDVINNKVADFEYVPEPNSLEVAYALYELIRVYHMVAKQEFELPSTTSDLADVCRYILLQEGYSSPVGMFAFCGPKGLVEGQTEEDTAAKLSAQKSYIAHMESL